MPNWCNTSYAFEGNKEEIADLYKKLQELEAMSEPLVENGFGKLWLGCVLTHFGGNWKDIYCKGEIDSIELEIDFTMRLSTTTGWSALPEIWDFVCEKYPSIKYYFSAEESGCNYYITNDAEGKYFPEKYIIHQRDGDTETANSLNDMLADVAERTRVRRITDKRMLRHVLKKYHKDNPDDFISVNRYVLIK